MTTFRNVAPFAANLDDGTPVTAALMVDSAGNPVTVGSQAPASAVWLDPLGGAGLNVDGSGTPVVRTITPEEGQTVTVYGLALLVQDATVGAVSDLGAVSGVVGGLTVEWSGGVAQLGPFKSNADFLLARGGPILPQSYGAEWVWLTIKHLQTPIVLMDADSLSVTITDNLTGLTAATLYALVVLG